MEEKVLTCSLPSLGKNISPLCPSMQASMQISPLSSGETKYRVTSFGAERGCLLAILCIHPSGSEPLLKATLAKRAVVTGNFRE